MSINLGNYENKVDSTLGNINFLRDNAEDVYKNSNMSQTYNLIKTNEIVKMAQYRDNKEEINNTKLLNWQNLLNKEKNLADAGLEILEKSQNMYVNDFNDNIVKLNDIDRDITTKDKIIQINYYEYDNKERTVGAMKSIILYLVLMIVPLILVVMGFVSKLYGFGFIILCGIITGTVILVRLNNSNDPNIEMIIEKTKTTAKDFAKDVIKDVFPKSFIKPCPQRCRPQSEEGEEPPLPVYDFNHGNEVWLDNSKNRWLQGDIPTIGATEEGYLALGEDAEPMPYYGGDKTTPQYTCKWKYDPTSMTNMDKGTTFTTTIPCEFYPGYETVEKK